MHVQANGISLNVRIDGVEGAPWLIVSNSLALTVDMWIPQVDLLARKYRVLRFDTRGHGGSDAPAPPYSFADLVADAIGLMDAHGIEQADWLGLSLGGMIGMEVALTHPGRIGRLAVAGSRGDAPPMFVSGWDERIAKIDDGGMEALVEPTIERWFTPAYRSGTPPSLDTVRSMIRATSPDGYRGCAAALKTLSILPRIGSLQSEALFMAGAGDGGAPPDAMRALADAAPKGRYLEIPDAAHIMNIENSAAFNEAVGTFFGIG